jgi:hypothetical protein
MAMLLGPSAAWARPQAGAVLLEDTARLSLGSTTAPSALELVGTAAAVAQGALEGGVQGAIDALPPPSPLLPVGMGMMALGNLALRSGVNAGASNVVFGVMYWGGLLSIPASFVLPFFEGRTPRTLDLDADLELEARIYLLSYDKASPLTGAFAREPEGLGVGYDWGLRYSHPRFGLLAGGDFTFQQSNIDANDFVQITAFFAKFDPKIGLDLARLLGWATDWSWLRRQRLSVQIGPSFFSNWIWLTEQGGIFVTRPREADLNFSIGLASGTGYELVGEASLDFGWVGGVKVIGQMGSYPSLSFPELRGRDAGLVALVGFDDLRGGDRYEWRRLIVSLDIPFVGFAKDGTLTVGGQLSQLEAGTGASVNNRGLSLGGSWRR